MATRASWSTRALGGVVVCAALAMPRVAVAGPFGVPPKPKGSIEEGALAALLVDVLLPDIYFRDDAQADLSVDFTWPLALRLVELDIGEVVAVNWTAAVEGQVNTACADGRIALVGRISIIPDFGGFDVLGLYASGGYVWGTDGEAPLVGGGLEFELRGIDASLMLGVRATLFEEERAALSFGFFLIELPLPVYHLYQDGDDDDAVVEELIR